MFEWREAPGFEGLYEVSNTGLVRDVKTGAIMPTRLCMGRDLPTYPMLDIKNATGKRCQPKVHRLVALAFVPNPEGKLFVNHKDSNKQNPDASNLEWVTHAENMRHAAEAGVCKAANNPRAAERLTTAQVVDIRQRASNGEKAKALSLEFNVSTPTIQKIITFKSRVLG